MGKRGEIFSSRLLKDKRSYFFNVHENFGNTLSLSIVESKNTEDENVYHRQSILVFEEDLDEFLKEMQKAVGVIKQMKMRPASSAERFRGNSDFGREYKVDEINKKPSSERRGARSEGGHSIRRREAPKKRIIIAKPANGDENEE